MTPNDRKLSNSRTLFLAGVCLSAGAAVSVLLLINAVRHQSGKPILWFAWLSITLISCSCLCLFSTLAAFMQRRLRQRAPITQKVATDGEYLAEYSRSDKATALVMACYFALSTAFFIEHSKKVALALSATIFVWTVWYVVHIVTTRVTFTHQGFVARLPWVRELREPYERVQRISERPGTLKIHFSGGRILRLHSGLGDPDAVIAHLQARCPESVYLD